mmetsp:Transcript_26344/g.44106  ORF Transcript_26344/g.44106 Transcript_26344/m.44106 type:complete len:225 (+) Transcript_26344:1500-2174(+)
MRHVVDVGSALLAHLHPLSCVRLNCGISRPHAFFEVGQLFICERLERFLLSLTVLFSRFGSSRSRSGQPVDSGEIGHQSMEGSARGRRLPNARYRVRCAERYPQPPNPKARWREGFEEGTPPGEKERKGEKRDQERDHAEHRVRPALPGRVLHYARPPPPPQGLLHKAIDRQKVHIHQLQRHLLRYFKRPTEGRFSVPPKGGSRESRKPKDVCEPTLHIFKVHV